MRVGCVSVGIFFNTRKVTELCLDRAFYQINFVGINFNTRAVLRRGVLMGRCEYVVVGVIELEIVGLQIAYC